MSRIPHRRAALGSAALAAVALILGSSIGVVDAAAPGVTEVLYDSTATYSTCTGQGGSSSTASSIDYTIRAARIRGRVSVVGATPSTTYVIWEAWTDGISCTAGPIGSLATDSQGNGSAHFRWSLPAEATAFNFAVASNIQMLATNELTR